MSLCAGEVTWHDACRSPWRMRNLLALALAVATAAAQADTFTLGGLALTNTGTLQLSGALNGHYYAGPFTASINGGASFRTYCADLAHSAHYGDSQAFTLTDTATLGSDFQLAARLLNKYGVAAGNDPLKNAALQGAIWKALNGSALTIADGTAGAAALANAYLAEDLSEVSNHALFYGLGGQNQSMIGVAPVPEPASIAALAVGGMGLLRRRKSA